MGTGVGLSIVGLGGQWDGMEFTSVASDEFFTQIKPKSGSDISAGFEVPNSRILWHDKTVFDADYLFIDPGYEQWLREANVIPTME